MANEKDKPVSDGVTNGEQARKAAPGADGQSKNTVPARVAQRQRRYLMAPRVLPGQMQPMGLDLLSQSIDAMPDVKIVKRLRSRGISALSAGPFGGGTDILVTEMSVDRGELLRRSAPPNVIVEHDAMLRHHDQVDMMKLLRTNLEATVLPSSLGVESTALKLRVVGEKGQALPRATVIAYGQGFPAQGTTDDKGEIELQLFGGPIDSVQALYIKPESNYWERFVSRPELGNSLNVIALDPLSATFNGFPDVGMIGWGQAMMGVDRLSSTMTGRGIRVAIVDSGCDTTHPQLSRAQGLDCTTDDNSGEGWRNDTVHHGTHCAGIIGASGTSGIRGFAPEAELHALKVFPGGRFSDLIEALDICIQRQIDVVNLSLGSPEPSELVERKIVEATSNGVACIVAAGNSASAVQFPGVLPQVLTVAAIGQMGRFPEDTYHAQTVLPGSVVHDNLFAAKFSCFGPQVGVCAPGVAIVSTVPGGYAAWDGTSMAAPHITGLAALVLAHHPAFQGNKDRSSQRVASLFTILRASAAPVTADAQRGGAGLPNAARALGQSASAPAQGKIADAGQMLGALHGQPASVATPTDAFPGNPASGGAGTAPGGVGYGGYNDGGIASVIALQQIVAQQAALADLLRLRAAGW